MSDFDTPIVIEMRRRREARPRRVDPTDMVADLQASDIEVTPAAAPEVAAAAPTREPAELVTAVEPAPIAEPPRPEARSVLDDDILSPDGRDASGRAVDPHNFLGRNEADPNPGFPRTQLRAPTLGGNAFASRPRIDPSMDVSFRPDDLADEPETLLAPAQFDPSSSVLDGMDDEPSGKPEARGIESPRADSILPWEREALKRGEHRQRVMRGLGGALAIGSGIAGMIGAARDMPVLAGLGAAGIGGATGLTGSAGNQLAGTQADITARRNADRQDYADAAALRQQGIADRNAAVGEMNAVGARDARVDSQRRANIELGLRTTENEARFRNDNPAAVLERAALRDSIDRYVRDPRGASQGRTAEDFNDIAGAAEAAGAEELRRMVALVNEATSSGQRRGAGGGHRGPRPGETPTPEQNAAYEDLVRIRARQSGMNPDTIRADHPISGAFDHSNPRSLSSLVNAQAPHDVTAQSTDRRRYAEAMEEPRGQEHSLAELVGALKRASPEQIAAALHGGDRLSSVTGATAVRSHIFQMLNDYFHTYGGANVTENEMYRYMAGFGAGSIAADPAEFVAAVRRTRAKVRGVMDSIAAGYSDDVVNGYNPGGQH